MGIKIVEDKWGAFRIFKRDNDFIFIEDLKELEDISNQIISILKEKK